VARRISVITGSRAEYGLLYWVLKDLNAAADVDLQLVVTGSHLAPEFGHTVDEIVRDGFDIARRVPMLIAGDTQPSVARSVGLGVIGFSDAFEALQPDIAVVLGDRFEILAAATAALIHNVPLAHIAGGDTTEGAIDEAIRHAVTKMAHLHFVTNEESAGRVRQLGEDPARIHVVGSPGLDHLRRRPLLDRAALEGSLGSTLGKRNILVTFHPATLDPGASGHQVQELLAALEALPPDVTIWFTGANADAGHRSIDQARTAFVAANRKRAREFQSLGHLRYLSLMSFADAVVGNSSSGLYEAPSFGIPTVDIGDRQRGRLAAASVLRCEPERRAIAATIAEALQLDCRGVVNMYGDGHAAERIVGLLRALPDPRALLKKRFHTLAPEAGHGR
jgi:UDP-N-acetylglucosamine 2-epimerase (non-hydrolysing)/GDP/UDP-N,N'-diacetylbacillosamine 2-epimerase (hydrolysing)